MADDITDDMNRNGENSLPGYFVTIPHEILLARNISDLDRWVWAVLAARCVYPNETCWPGEKNIAALLGKDERTIKRCVNRLKRKELVITEGRHPTLKTNIYRLFLPDGTSFTEWRTTFVSHVTHGDAANAATNGKRTDDSPPQTQVTKMSPAHGTKMSPAQVTEMSSKSYEG